LSLCRDYRGAYAAGSAEEVINDPQVRLVYIASNHASHAEYAIACLNAGKSVHIEKPQVVSDDQLERLLDAQTRHPDMLVFLGFNRPHSPHFQRIRASLIKQSGPTMINWFIAGHRIPDGNWYFNPGEGGRVLGNLCHWTDLTLCLVGVDHAFPCEIVPACEPASKSDFCVGIKFNDHSLAGITFSAKGHTFEGVHEKLNAHRGDALVSITDFKQSTIEIMERKRKFTTLHRDHGHSQNIKNSYLAVRDNDRARAVDARYNKATALIFLGVKKAIDSGTTIKVTLD
jgi:predicted dehydrogenase